jgi:hypothetical protein
MAAMAQSFFGLEAKDSFGARSALAGNGPHHRVSGDIG